MTKDWDSVRPIIKELSVDQKKNLEDVKSIMETQFRFRASTRAYRMKLKAWGYTRYRRRDRKTARANSIEEDAPPMDGESESDSDTTEPPMETNNAPMEEAEDLVPRFDPLTQAANMTNDVLMDMLECILDADSTKLEKLVLRNKGYVNLPIGLPFDALGGRFFNHPAMSQCVILQHGGQTLLDIASGLPPSSCLWVLFGHGAKGSRHPLGTDLSLHNAIKNGRSITVRSLISMHSKVDGLPETTWKPLMQAAFWNFPEITRILLDQGAQVDGSAAPLDGKAFKTALQMALERRIEHYFNPDVRERCVKSIKMLLDAGANIHVPPAESSKPNEPVEVLTTFEAFIKPWQSNQLWAKSVEGLELDCLESFIRKGANLQTSFVGFPCSSPSSNSFEHQILWHSTPAVARLLVDNASPVPGGNGSNLLHEIIGSCPDTKRHPTETLRDVDVLLKRGADPNSVDGSGVTPLRKCIESCPGVDIVDRLGLLVEGGADPELNDRNGIQPVVLAARAFGPPLLPQIMETLIKKYQGRFPQNYNGLSSWTEGYFPIPKNLACSDALRYTHQNGDFTANLQNMIPPDVRVPFQRAAFSVASTNFLDSITRKLRTARDPPLTSLEKEGINQIVMLRRASGITDYRFNQDFVMALLLGTPSAPPQPARDPMSVTNFNAIFMTGQLPALSSGPNDLPVSDSGPLDTSQSVGMERQRSNASNASDGSDGSLMFPTTTQVRWTAIGRATRPGDAEKVKTMVLDHECTSCNNGLKLTKAEFEKHEQEHLHTITCCDEGCKRRFCIAERHSMRAPGALD